MSDSLVGWWILITNRDETPIMQAQIVRQLDATIVLLDRYDLNGGLGDFAIFDLKNIVIGMPDHYPSFGDRLITLHRHMPIDLPDVEPMIPADD